MSCGNYLEIIGNAEAWLIRLHLGKNNRAAGKAFGQTHDFIEIELSFWITLVVVALMRVSFPTVPGSEPRVHLGLLDGNLQGE